MNTIRFFKIRQNDTKLMILGLIVGFLQLIGVSALAHPTDPRVSIELESTSALNAGSIEIKFQLLDTKTNKILDSSDLNITHEKRLHAFLFDPALKEFRHEHPEYKDGFWILNSSLSVNGNYWFWVQGEIASDSEEFSSSERLLLKNGTKENEVPVELGDVRSGADGNSQVVLDSTTIHAKKQVMLDLTFSRADGSKPQITPYLGAMAHIVAVPLDGDSLLHVHPMNSSDTQMTIHTQFPEKGDYRLWLQFIDGGVLKIIPLSVRVVK